MWAGVPTKYFHFFVLLAFLSQVKESIQLLADNGNPYKPIILANFTRIVHPKELGVKFVTRKGKKKCQTKILHFPLKNPQ